MKVRFLNNFYDKVGGVYYASSTDFVEVPNHVVERLKERELLYNVKEYDEPKSDKKPNSAKLPNK